MKSDVDRGPGGTTQVLQVEEASDAEGGRLDRGKGGSHGHA